MRTYPYQNSRTYANPAFNPNSNSAIVINTDTMPNYLKAPGSASAWSWA